MRAAYISLDAVATPSGNQCSSVFKAPAYLVIDLTYAGRTSREQCCAHRSRAYYPAYPAKWFRREFEATLARLVEAWVGINEAVG